MVRYTPVLSEPALEYEEQHDGWGSPVPDSAVQRSPSSFWRVAHAADFTVWFVLVACLISVSSLALNIAILSHSVQRITPLPQKLIFPNSYIGLENAILRDTAPLKPIINFPLLIAQINSSEPSAVYLQQSHSLTSFGMVYPEDREFIVDSEVSTIAQFRALDFGLEQCIATLEIPSPVAIQNKSGKSILSSNDGCALGIWYLDAPESIQLDALSWAVRPRRLNQLTTFIVHQGHNLLESPPFACMSRTLFAFELEYSSPGCYLYFRQDKRTPRLAFYITQHQSTGQQRIEFDDTDLSG
ncbi:hypothetical protein C8R43DRAFT_1076087 [Mycena crocata]|nr:hypothetical protein C8R43DRAFT_1076087 [Mycena crocata]